MDDTELDNRLVAKWNSARDDLGIRVTAPIKLLDPSGAELLCEALVHDFGSPTGAIVVSPKTERRTRQHLRALADTRWISISSDCETSAYVRKHFIDELIDWRWFGPSGDEPSWYRG